MRLTRSILDIRPILALILISGLALQHAEAGPNDNCIYQKSDGTIVRTKSLSQVPSAYKNSALCGSDAKLVEQQAQPSGQTYLAKPGEITLEGNIRREFMSTPIGRVQLRWPRKVELLFGRNPSRAVADAAKTVGRAIRSAGFPAYVQDINSQWQIVFMDEELPETQIPTQLISNCHPGWMTPPANIYIVAQRVAAGCSGEKAVRSSAADALLAQVLIHEMGHAVEYVMLRERNDIPLDRMRAEGFATWFEQFASTYSSVVDSSAVRSYRTALALASLKQSPDHFSFQGTGEDYGRASMYFEAIFKKRGIRGIVDLYETVLKQPTDLETAASLTMNWTPQTLQDEVRRAALGQ